VPFGRKVGTNNRDDVKKTVTIVFLAEIFCLVLGTTSLAEVANIESPYVFGETTTRRNSLEIMLSIQLENVKRHL
jgi:hypothetical protein